jgi:hypothetical protein
VSTSTPCSVLNSQSPLAGTAPTSDSWLILFHQGAWGERPVETLVSQDLKIWAHAQDAKILLARSPQNVDPHPTSTYWYSNSVGELRQGTLNAEGLPDLRFTNISSPLLLICTNGKRDQCCATFGRNLITQCKESLAPESFSHILECTHLGGHRFAPTAIWLPQNLVLGRLDLIAVSTLLDKGEVSPQFLRGSTRLSPAEQVVQVFLWPATPDFQSCQQINSDFHIEVVIDGVAGSFVVAATDVDSVASCGAEPKNNTQYSMLNAYS